MKEWIGRVLEVLTHQSVTLTNLMQMQLDLASSIDATEIKNRINELQGMHQQDISMLRGEIHVTQRKMDGVQKDILTSLAQSHASEDQQPTTPRRMRSSPYARPGDLQDNTPQQADIPTPRYPEEEAQETMDQQLPPSTTQTSSDQQPNTHTHHF